MNKRILISSVICVLFFSCTNSEKKKENDIELMKSNLISYANDIAFKSNGKIKIYEVKVIKVDTIDKKSIDSSFITLEATVKSDSYLNQSKTAQSKTKLSLSLLELAQLSGDSYHIKKYKEEGAGYLDEARLYIDSSKYILKIADSLLKLVAKNNSLDKIYKLKTFIKATSYYGKDSLNTMDTVYYSFTKDLNLYPPDKSDYKIKY